MSRPTIAASQRTREWKVPAGFRAVSAVFGSVGLIATAATLSEALFIPLDFVHLSAISISVIFAAANLWFTFVATPRRWMAMTQGIILAVLGLMMSFFADPPFVFGSLVYGVALCLLLVQGAIASFKVLVFLLLAGLILDVSAAIILTPEALGDIVRVTIIPLGMYAVIAFGIGLEVIRLRAKEESTNRDQPNEQ